LNVPEHWLCYLSPELMRQLRTGYDAAAHAELPFSIASDVYAFG
jgi:hypothetical protein